MKKFAWSFIFLLGSGISTQAASIQSISDNGPVGNYEKFEIGYDLGRTYSNPFDPAQIDVTVEFKSPTGKLHSVKGFIYQDYERTGDIHQQTLTPKGGLGWKARFAPDEVGEWSYSIRAKDDSSTATASPRSFKVESSSNRGFVRISTNDPEYFAFDNGGCYFPVGENMGWSGSGRTFQFDKWIGSLAENGGNFIRVWQAGWHTEYEWAYSYPATTLLPGNYLDRLREAWELDHILDLATQKNIYVMLCLINHGKFSTTNDSNWKDNPYNKKANPKGGFLDKPEELWTNDKAKMFIQRNWRYLVARYANYTSLQSWELFNEMEWIDHYSSSVTLSAKFHQEMGDYLRSIDPYGHLVTTSYAHALQWPTTVWDSGMQFVQEHNYGGMDMAQVADGLIGGMRAKCPGKPAWIGEMGIGDGAEVKLDPTGIFIHGTQWGSLTAKASGAGFPWWWDNYVDPNNLYFRFKGISSFTSGEDLDRRGYQPIGFTVSTSQMSDLSFSPGNSAWGVKAAEDHFVLGTDGSITPGASNLTGFIYSTAKNQFRNPPTFHLELTRPSVFKVVLNAVSAWGTNNLTIQMDGKPTEVNKSLAKANAVYEAKIPAGSHDVSVDSTGQDWVQVASYSIGNYVGALSCKALRGRGKTLGYVRSRGFNYGNPRPNKVTKAVLKLDGLNQDGPWKIEWWDTEKGVIVHQAKVSVKNGTAQAPVPPVSTDLAFKLIYAGR